MPHTRNYDTFTFWACLGIFGQACGIIRPENKDFFVMRQFDASNIFLARQNYIFYQFVHTILAIIAKSDASS